ncbi:hypothetical protein OCK72_08860 [Fusobacterium simiae]|uniref:Lipoprotein n=1 Tax=Fusobacterium simiae TaxID=855 RepID=A0ABT4DN69_FUSSI|nr:hypothetical protein [Fusobacterium simiae]MCY7008734.1 hypothetical protein [Fusobacterium simiae]
MKKIFILLLFLLGLLAVSCGKKWDYQVTKKESIQIGNDITFYFLTLKEKEGDNEIDSLQITKEGFDKYNVEDKLTKEELEAIKIPESTLSNSDLTLKGNYCIVENDSSTDLRFIPENTEFSILAIGKQEDVTPTIPTMLIIDKEHKLFYVIILKNQWDAEEFEYTINKDDLKNIEARHMATGNYDENDLSSIENLKNDIHFVEEEK